MFSLKKVATPAKPPELPPSPTRTVALLYPSIYHMSLWELERATQEICRDNNMEIVETIVAKDAYDLYALRNLIRSIKNQQGCYQESVALVISEVTNLSSKNFIPAWCVFDTLQTLKLVNSVLVFKSDCFGNDDNTSNNSGDYHRNHSKNESKKSHLEKCNRDFLQESVGYFNAN